MKEPLLAILIPTLTSRAHLLERLVAELDKQRAGKNVILIIAEDQGQKTTGQKRNELVQAAVINEADYICFIDDDDLPGENYIVRMLEGMALGVDCCSLLGRIYFKGRPGNPFHHSIKYDHWYQDKNMYYRNPNHLNCIKLDLVKDIPFNDQTIGEDGHWSIALQQAGVLKNEYEINEVIYHYYK
jgi:cellulose synthase/poly-beta-1,6-N-acetylglucosamine synthase-like glycosyltransferase